MNSLLDYCFGPAYSKGGQRLGGWGRLTHNWLWTDDPELVRSHQEQDVRDRQERQEQKMLVHNKQFRLASALKR